MRFIPSRLTLTVVAVLLPFCVVTALVGPPFSFVAPMVAGVSVLSLLFWDGVSGPRGRDIDIEREMPRRLEVGAPAEIRLVVRNRGSRPWRVKVADGCPPALHAGGEPLDVLLPGGGEATLSYPVRPDSRGSFAFTRPLLRMRKLRGFAEHLRSVELPGEAKVLPGLDGLVRHRLRGRRELMHLGGARKTRVLGRDGDFDRLRDFVAGDDIRHVDWKATARLRRPISRVWQAEKAQNLVVLVDGTRLMATRSGDLTKLDHAVRAALTLAWAGLSAGDRVGVGVFDERMRSWVPPAMGKRRFGTLLHSLYDQQPAQLFPSYQEAARHVLRSLSRRSMLVWITDLLDADQGDELIAALTVVRKRHLSLVVALDDPGVRAQATREPRTTSDLFMRVGAAEVLDERRLLLQRLQAAGAKVIDSPGDRLAPDLVDRYLEIKTRGLI